MSIGVLTPSLAWQGDRIRRSSAAHPGAQVQLIYRGQGMLHRTQSFSCALNSPGGASHPQPVVGQSRMAQPVSQPLSRIPTNDAIFHTACPVYQ